MKSNIKNKGRDVGINDTTLRSTQSAHNILGFQTLNRLPSEITKEQLRAITKDGTDPLYSCLAQIALSRGIWILKEAAQ